MLDRLVEEVAAIYQKKINISNKYSIENYNLLDGMKRYLRIEHQDDDKELLDYLRKQAGLHRN
jgi:hypothetical protein